LERQCWWVLWVQDIKTQFLEAQARYGLGETATAAELVALVLQRDPAHAQAADLAAEITRADGQNA
jgi:hypothetical protein